MSDIAGRVRAIVAEHREVKEKRRWTDKENRQDPSRVASSYAVRTG